MDLHNQQLYRLVFYTYTITTRKEMQYFFIYYCIIYRRNSLSVHITFYIDFI